MVFWESMLCAEESLAVLAFERERFVFATVLTFHLWFLNSKLIIENSS
jgi:hypothetical protein